jgi:hypothetical protein
MEAKSSGRCHIMRKHARPVSGSRCGVRAGYQSQYKKHKCRLYELMPQNAMEELVKAIEIRSIAFEAFALLLKLATKQSLKISQVFLVFPNLLLATCYIIIKINH